MIYLQILAILVALKNVRSDLKDSTKIKDAYMCIQNNITNFTVHSRNDIIKNHFILQPNVTCRLIPVFNTSYGIAFGKMEGSSHEVDSFHFYKFGNSKITNLSELVSRGYFGPKVSFNAQREGLQLMFSETLLVNMTDRDNVEHWIMIRNKLRSIDLLRKNQRIKNVNLTLSVNESPTRKLIENDNFSYYVTDDFQNQSQRILFFQTKNTDERDLIQYFVLKKHINPADCFKNINGTAGLPTKFLESITVGCFLLQDAFENDIKVPSCNLHSMLFVNDKSSYNFTGGIVNFHSSVFLGKTCYSIEASD